VGIGLGFLNISVTVRLFGSDDLSFSRRVTRMTEEKTTRELVYETNRDVKWICRALQRMEAQDEEFESRLRALEGWRAEKAGEERLAEGQEFEHRKVRERRVSTISAGAGGVVGGVVAVLVKVLGGG